MKELLTKSVGNVLVAIPAMIMTAFAQLFLNPLVSGVKLALEDIYSNARVKEDQDQWLVLRITNGYATAEEILEYCDSLEKKDHNLALKARFLNGVATKAEAEEYFSVYRNEYTQEEIDGYMKNFEEGGEV